MKRFINIVLVVVAAVGIVACTEQYTTYDDREYLMFSDTLSTHMVVEDGRPFGVEVSSTVTRDYDRTYAVEIIDKGSNAIEGHHYRLGSNTITIPAGKLSTNVEVYGNYENIEPTDSLGFTLQLVMRDELKWDLYPEYNRTKVVMYKSCPFDINEWGGTEQKPKYCLLTSLLLYSYPGTNTSYSRLIRCYKHKSMENTIVMDDMFYDGFDVLLTFDTADPAQPILKMQNDQVIGEEFMVFGYQYGDGKILATHSPRADQPSSFNSCQKFAQLWVLMYVKDFSTTIGYMGYFYNILEWISDEEAEEIMREGL
ncbi:MAG: DUF4984 domain-containing protein [Alistipes sp.]|nr:DUF4984 domain-containing protein [Alistipes sp.]